MRGPLLALLLVAPVLAGCATSDEEPVDVMTTFYPLAFLAERVSDGELRVGTMVPAGIEPHAWEPSPTDVARAADAKVFLAQGRGLEPWLDDLHHALGDRAPALVYTTTGLAEREGGHEHEEEGHEDEAHANETEEEHAAHANESEEEHAAEEETGEGPVDPHTWLDPKLFAQQAAKVEAALSAAFPDRAETFRANVQRLVADLDALHEEYDAALHDCETRTIVANHDAYGYLAARYDFEVVAISGLSPEAEPSPEDIARAIDAAREHNATIIFFEELVSPRVAQVVAREVGAQTRVLSPIEGLSDEARAAGEDYVSLMRDNLVGLREAMRCA